MHGHGLRQSRLTLTLLLGHLSLLQISHRPHNPTILTAMNPSLHAPSAYKFYNQLLQSFDPFATHPFTRYSSPPTPNTAPTFIQPSESPSSPPAQKPIASSSSAKHPASTSTSRIFTSYSGRLSPDPELDQILKKKKAPAKNKS
ncbi:uncharacterized protein EV420DRAFT_1507950 [Desarmillaria tabescens]|uniref:Uncharacterized protein n=1 Tax=Armillaria tabescens TaxID=1929756 RepID=A0AA39NKM5_ARMTA|nr:uncharacterized protein EV420DRAFT_1507950 [Desarmillaria tabescens]KAK0467269.1 hypothetical protein EV420DRAFT_1507950 [Desarmillaria tabescens]